ncbi:hypothetical protein J7399_10340 [Shimia sp. R9_1]|nr:hypothetical protein [Shimia sp. R9_1]
MPDQWAMSFNGLRLIVSQLGRNCGVACLVGVHICATFWPFFKVAQKLREKLAWWVFLKGNQSGARIAGGEGRLLRFSGEG